LEGFGSWIRLVSVRNDLDRFFNEQLAKLQTEYIDFYLFHGLNRERWTKIQEVDALGWAEEKMDAGAIGHLGFSFHDDVEVFQEIVDGYDGWTFCQIQYNYVDTEYQAGTRGLTYAASKGLAVVVMEPIQGWNLAVKPPDAIQAIWDEARTQRTPADWALQWVWNQPEVAVALSGMGNMDQVIENLESASRSCPATLTEEELALLSRVREHYLAIGFIGCTGCRYCVPCPEGVAIPEILALYNEHYARRGDPDAQQAITTKYGETISPAHGAVRCVKCGACEDKCPQRLPIRNLLTRAARSLNRPT
jgi:predicted aldo/keto reductase-like oxidoreductase